MSYYIDGNGWSDLAETDVFLTRPDAPADKPRPRLTLDGPELLVEVPHQAGHTWRLERSTDAATWQLADGAPLDPDADYTFAKATGWTTLRLPRTAPAEFFRIRYRRNHPPALTSKTHPL